MNHKNLFSLQLLYKKKYKYGKNVILMSHFVLYYTLFRYPYGL